MGAFTSGREGMFAERAAVWTGCQRVEGGGERSRGRTGDGGD